MTVAITGAAGQLGSLVAEQLLETLPPEEVILITRRPEELQRFADRGVRVRRADLDEPETLAPAFDGADRLLLISTTHQSTPRRVQQHTDAVAGHQACVEERIAEPIGLSVEFAEADRSSVFAQAWRVAEMQGCAPDE